MSPTYRPCPACGKRALSVATRCPGCGVEFPPRTARRRAVVDLGRVWPLVAVIAVVTVSGALVGSALRKPVERTEASAAPPAPELDTAMAAASPAAPTGERRFARTWTNVRDRRTVRADVVGVLLPGDLVLADSLERGWWRVSLEGQIVGYVSESTLDTIAPATAP